MPANSFDLYNMHDARNNFEAMRPAPICSDANRLVGQCQKIHVSMNCYYGYQGANISSNDAPTTTDCEMMDIEDSQQNSTNVGRKRSADAIDYSQTKRIREAAEVQREKGNEPETTSDIEVDSRKEDLTELLYWNIHGGNMFHLLQCS